LIDSRAGRTNQFDTRDLREIDMAASPNLRFINPSTMSKPPGYTHVIEATGPGRIVYIAGQLGLTLEQARCPARRFSRPSHPGVRKLEECACRRRRRL
jgi:hypothetical protein